MKVSRKVIIAFALACVLSVSMLGCAASNESGNTSGGTSEQASDKPGNSVELDRNIVLSGYGDHVSYKVDSMWQENIRDSDDKLWTSATYYISESDYDPQLLIVVANTHAEGYNSREDSTYEGFVNHTKESLKPSVENGSSSELREVGEYEANGNKFKIVAHDIDRSEPDAEPFITTRYYAIMKTGEHDVVLMTVDEDILHAVIDSIQFK